MLQRLRTVHPNTHSTPHLNEPFQVTEDYHLGHHHHASPRRTPSRFKLK
jgi:hypothetical protein